MTENAVVTTTLNGEEISKEECPPDDYVIVCGPNCWIDGMQVYANGTVVLTIKREKARS